MTSDFIVFALGHLVAGLASFVLLDEDRKYEGCAFSYFALLTGFVGLFLTIMRLSAEESRRKGGG